MPHGGGNKKAKAVRPWLLGAVVWSGRWESNPRYLLGKQKFYH